MTPYNTRHLVGVAPCSGSYDFRSQRLCTRCGHRRPTKGGTNYFGSRFVCAACKAKQVAK